MKTLICYATKKGTTLKCAKLIAEQVVDFTLVDIKRINAINLQDFEKVYIGTPVYYGSINSKVKKFILKNKQELLKKDLRIFTVGMDDKNIQGTRKRNFDQDILNKARIEYVGGGYNFEQMNFLERFIVKKISSVEESMENIKTEKISLLVSEE